MFKNTPAFSGFSVNNLEMAKKFYGDTLGLEVVETHEGLQLTLGSAATIFVYSKPNHEPATFTILNFIVEDIDNAVEQLIAKGVTFEHYSGELQTDEKGIARGLASHYGPDIAWFKDPAGNILSVLQEE